MNDRGKVGLFLPGVDSHILPGCTPGIATLPRQTRRPVKLNDRAVSTWHKFGFALTAITVVPTVGLVIASSELAVGLELMGWLFLCVMPQVAGMVVCVARRFWLASRLTRHSMEPEGHILLPPVAVIAVGVSLASTGWIHDARFALSRSAFERAVRSGETFEDYEGKRWVGLYKVHSIQIDKLGRTAFNLGDCSMFAHCELEFDATTPCQSRGWFEYETVDTHWCVVTHDHL
jgi:hypothetical protein